MNRAAPVHFRVPQGLRAWVEVGPADRARDARGGELAAVVVVPRKVIPFADAAPALDDWVVAHAHPPQVGIVRLRRRADRAGADVQLDAARVHHHPPHPFGAESEFAVLFVEPCQHPPLHFALRPDVARSYERRDRGGNDFAVGRLAELHRARRLRLRLSVAGGEAQRDAVDLEALRPLRRHLAVQFCVSGAGL